uniref:Uncharacterized protein n=1 Tax=Tanacetum cinerariifolium TaxID=118510 RepID=A0A6L2N5U6_TANCI|nr:hypothetical protein [Tanacetum cinerariifolium]
MVIVVKTSTTEGLCWDTMTKDFIDAVKDYYCCWSSWKSLSGPIKNAINNAYSTARRPINNRTTSKNSKINQKVNTVRAKKVNTSRKKAVLNAVQGNHGNPKKDLKDKGVTDSGCSRNMTRNRSYLIDYEEIDGGFVTFGVPRKDNMYSVDLKNVVPKGGLTCLFAKATSEESNLWQRRLGHVNFKTINKLVKGNLVRGLPLNFFEIDETYVACQKGKQHRASCKTKIVSLISQPLQMLHMDLFGPTFVKSLMKKMYCLVVTNDFSRFSWVFFLATKDETSKILKTFITGIENLIDLRVKVIRCNNRTEFKNKVMNQKHALSFIRPFGCPVTILNTIDHLDALTKSMNYKPVVAENQSNGSTGIRAFDTAGEEENKDAIDLGNEDNQAPSTKEPRVNQEKDSVNSTNGVNVVSLTVNAASNQVNVVGRKSSIELPDDPNMHELEDISIFEESNKDIFGAEADLNNLESTFQGHTQEEGIDYDEVFSPFAKIEAIRLFPAYVSFKDFMVYQMNVKSNFLYEKIEEKVYVCQPLGFEDPNFPNKVYKVEKALYGLHQAPRAWKEMCTAFEKMMHKKFQMSSMGELTFFLGLQVKQKEDGIFISQDKPNIMFEVCACARFQVNPKISHLHAMKRIFRYLKDQPKLGLWYPKDSPFDLVAYTDSDYARASLDRKSTTKGCQFLGCRLISWQCKKQTVVANSITKAEKQKPRKTRRQDTELPQTSVPTKTVADEAINEEMHDSLKRATNTATSLDAEHDRGNISKNQSKATPNEPSSLGTSSGGGPKRQDTIAQTRSGNVSKFSNDPPLSRVNTLGSEDDIIQFKALMELYTKLSDRVLSLETTKTAQATEIANLKKRVKRLERKRKSRSHGLKRLYKVGLSTRVKSSTDEESLDEDIFGVNDQDDTLMFDADKDLQGDELDQERSKKQKIEDENESAEIKSCLEIVPDDGDEVTINATPLSSKSPTIVDYKIYKEGRKIFFQIFKADGNSQMVLSGNHGFLVFAFAGLTPELVEEGSDDRSIPLSVIPLANEMTTLLGLPHSPNHAKRMKIDHSQLAHQIRRKARKPNAMIYTCSLPEVDVEKRALMQGKELPENNVRLACVKHIASVPSEPGSNSSFDYDLALQCLVIDILEKLVKSRQTLSKAMVARNGFSQISFNSTIKLVSFDKSQVVTFNSEFVYGFRNGDCETGSGIDNTVHMEHKKLFVAQVVCFFVRMELFCFVDEVFDLGFVPVMVVVQEVQSWKHVYASKGEFVLVQFSKKLYGDFEKENG